jgi:hypothetical protein
MVTCGLLVLRTKQAQARDRQGPMLNHNLPFRCFQWRQWPYGIFNEGQEEEKGIH